MSDVPGWAQLACERVGAGEYRKATHSLVDLYLCKRIEWNDVLNFIVVCELSGVGRGQAVLTELKTFFFPHFDDLEKEFTDSVNKYKDEENKVDG